MEKEPHPAISDSVPPDWVYLADENHDPDDDRDDFLGKPGFNAMTFSYQKWLRENFVKQYPPKHLQSDPE